MNITSKVGYICATICFLGLVHCVEKDIGLNYASKTKCSYDVQLKENLER